MHDDQEVRGTKETLGDVDARAGGRRAERGKSRAGGPVLSEKGGKIEDRAAADDVDVSLVREVKEEEFTGIGGFETFG